MKELGLAIPAKGPQWLTSGWSLQTPSQRFQVPPV